MAVTVLQNVNQSNLEKIESFMNDTTYKEAIESSANYNTRLCIERRLRLPFLDSQTGVAQNHSSLFMHKRQRMPGLMQGQIYTYPRQRWRKKRRQYLIMNSRAFARAADSILEGEGDVHSISQSENPALQDTDSKDSQLLKDEVSKEWFYDEQDMIDMEAYDEPDPDSDLDYEESYSKRSKRRKGSGRGRGGSDSPSTPGRRKGGGRGRKKASAHSFEPTPGDPDKPFACELCGARYKTRPGLTYHYGHSHKEGASDENSRESNAPTTSVSPLLGGLGVNPAGTPILAMGVAAGPTPSGGGIIQSNLMGEPMPPVPPPGQGPPIPGHVYQDSYVSFLSHPAGTPARRGRQPANPQSLPPPPQSQAPPTLPPNLPAQIPTVVDDPPMPVLVPEKTIEPPPSTSAEVPKDNKAAPSPYCDFCLGDSRENKKTGTSEELVSCSDCGRSEMEFNKVCSDLINDLSQKLY